jgi:hypothetical protein
MVAMKRYYRCMPSDTPSAPSMIVSSFHRNNPIKTKTSINMDCKADSFPELMLLLYFFGEEDSQQTTSREPKVSSAYCDDSFSFNDSFRSNQGRLSVDEHAKLKTKMKTKQSSQPRATSPTCVSRVTWGPTQVSWIPEESHKGSHKGSLKESHKESHNTIGPRDPTRSEGSHKHTGCNRHRSVICCNLRSSHNFIIISEPNVLIWLC